VRAAINKQQKIVDQCKKVLLHEEEELAYCEEFLTTRAINKQQKIVDQCKKALHEAETASHEADQ